jgi:uncharacterized membrane protein
MEIPVAAIVARDHEVLINYFLILVSIPYGIICLVAMCLEIELYLMLWVGFFSVIVLVFNCQLSVLTGVEPGTGLDGMYVIADILAVAMIVLTFLLRYIREADDENEDDDE